MSRRYRRWISWRWLALIILLGIVAGRAVILRGDRGTPAPFAGEGKVLQILDGETLLVQPLNPSADPAQVRFLAISVPPEHSAQAVAFLSERLEQGQVVLALDKRRIDSQGRLLAYVYVDDRLLNAELVQHGLAQVALYPGDSASIGRELYRAQDTAHAQRLGIWAHGERRKKGSSPAETAVED